MYRHSPIRNPRSKGIKIKHVLQICLLVAVCFWLIFQVKRSHDKKKEFDASDTKISLGTRSQSSGDIVKFGRKDLQPKLEETTKEVETHEGQEEQEEHEENKQEEEEQEDHEENKQEEEEQEDHEENKHEEDEQEEHEENKHEEEEQDEDKIEEEKDDGGGGGDDEIDENEQEKSDIEIDREEVDIIDEDKETEVGDEKESEEKDGQSHTENGVSLGNHDEDGATIHTHEAREEHYRADDASSAVTHDARTLGTQIENENGTSDNSSENAGLVDNSDTAENGASSNITVLQETGTELIVTSLNATTSIDSHENGPPSDTKLITSDSTQAQNVTEGVTVPEEQAGNSSIASSVGHQYVPPNATSTVTERSSNSTSISEVSKSNESIAKENSSSPSEPEVETNAGQGESWDTNNVMEGTEENLDSYETKNPDEVQHDTIDSTDPSHLEEKEVRTDLSTLPETETEGGDSIDATAE